MIYTMEQVRRMGNLHVNAFLSDIALREAKNLKAMKEDTYNCLYTELADALRTYALDISTDDVIFKQYDSDPSNFVTRIETMWWPCSGKAEISDRDPQLIVDLCNPPSYEDSFDYWFIFIDPDLSLKEPEDRVGPPPLNPRYHVTGWNAKTHFWVGEPVLEEWI